MWEALFLHHLNGLTDDTFYAAKMPFFLRQLRHLAVREYWERIGPKLYDPRFTEFVSSALKETESSQANSA